MILLFAARGAQLACVRYAQGRGGALGRRVSLLRARKCAHMRARVCGSPCGSLRATFLSLPYPSSEIARRRIYICVIRRKYRFDLKTA